MTKRAVLYARVSSEHQEEGTSLDGQLRRMREHAQRKGYRVVEELQEAHTGADPDRPGLDRLRELAGGGQIDVVVVFALDRFMREETQAVIVEYELERLGVTIDYMDLPDPEGAGYRFLKAFKRIAADDERCKIAERTHRGRRDRVRQGSTLVFGHPPYGYRVEKDEQGLYHLVIDEEAARIVRLIYEWYVRGDESRGPMGARAISRRLTKMGVPTPSQKSGEARAVRGQGDWGRSEVFRILKSETYAGVWYYGKERNIKGGRVVNPEEAWIAVEVPAIVDRETWELACKRREQNKRVTRRKPKYPYLLRRRATCGECGYKTQCSTRENGRYRYYACPSGGQQDPTRQRPCNLPYFRADEVEPAVWHWIKGLLMDPEYLSAHLRERQAAQALEAHPLRERLAIVEELLAKDQARRELLLDQYLDGLFGRELLAERKHQLEEQIGRLKEERVSLRAYLEKQVLTDAQIQTIESLAGKIRQALDRADEDFETRCRVVELLDVQVTLAVEEGEKVVYARCMVNEDVLSLSLHTTCGGGSERGAAAPAGCRPAASR